MTREDRPLASVRNLRVSVPYIEAYVATDVLKTC
jgi:hypothetical protein